MADSSYTLNLITSPGYQKVSEMVFSLAANDDVKEKMKMVLYEGKLTPEDSGKKLSIKSTSFLEVLLLYNESALTQAFSSGLGHARGRLGLVRSRTNL